MRRTLALAVLVAGFVLAASPAHAEVGPKEGIAELDRSRALIDKSLVLYENGRAEEAYEAALSAYLDHFEYTEIPLRVRDEGLTLQAEEEFATLRNQIEAGAPLEEVEATATDLRRSLDRVERTLSSPGLAAPVLATLSGFVILFREGFEAVLIVAAILGYLEASRNTQYRGAVLKGVGLAVVATIVTYAAAATFLSLAPVQRELLEGVTAVVAVVVLFWVSFWLISRLEHRRWMEFVRAKVWAAASTGSTLALAGVGFTAVYREGFETTLFYQALLSFAEGLANWVALGALLAACALGAVGYFIFKAGRRLPIKPFMTVAVLMVMGLSVAFIGNSVRALQEAAVFPVTFLDSLPRLPIFLADLTGWHPTRETIIAQAALTLVYVLGAVWTFVILPRREGPLAPRTEPRQEPSSDQPEPETTARR